ncbi:MAG: superoxide dismutase family protein [Candidatus Eremiobacteraeota bacterium]|nr:superoxide dismutase family protein [Candidatus Eremiobacteraeota bacterium]
MVDSRKTIGLLAILACALAGPSAVAFAAPQTFDAPIFNVAGKQIGDARFIGQPGGGTQIIINVSGLPPGQHGMHIHEVGSCLAIRDTQGVATPFAAAGGHFDPAHTGHHLGPNGGGHAGDLPNLTIDSAGNGGLAYYAPSLQVSGSDTIVGRSIVIHANPDNYTDTPPVGGSGGRIACGEIGALR